MEIVEQEALASAAVNEPAVDEPAVDETTSHDDQPREVDDEEEAAAILNEQRREQAYEQNISPSEQRGKRRQAATQDVFWATNRNDGTQRRDGATDIFWALGNNNNGGHANQPANNNNNGWGNNGAGWNNGAHGAAPNYADPLWAVNSHATTYNNNAAVPNNGGWNAGMVANAAPGNNYCAMPFTAAVGGTAYGGAAYGANGGWNNNWAANGAHNGGVNWAANGAGTYGANGAWNNGAHNGYAVNGHFVNGAGAGYTNGYGTGGYGAGGYGAGGYGAGGYGAGAIGGAGVLASNHGNNYRCKGNCAGAPLGTGWEWVSTCTEAPPGYWESQMQVNTVATTYQEPEIMKVQAKPAPHPPAPRPNPRPRPQPRPQPRPNRNRCDRYRDYQRNYDYRRNEIVINDGSKWKCMYESDCSIFKNQPKLNNERSEYVWEWLGYCPEERDEIRPRNDGGVVGIKGPRPDSPKWNRPNNRPNGRPNSRPNSNNRPRPNQGNKPRPQSARDDDDCPGYDNWGSNANYRKNDVVGHRGARYKCLSDEGYCSLDKFEPEREEGWEFVWRLMGSCTDDEMRPNSGRVANKNSNKNGGRNNNGNNNGRPNRNDRYDGEYGYDEDGRPINAMGYVSGTQDENRPDGMDLYSSEGFAIKGDTIHVYANGGGRHRRLRHSKRNAKKQE